MKKLSNRRVDKLSEPMQDNNRQPLTHPPRPHLLPLCIPSAIRPKMIGAGAEGDRTGTGGEPDRKLLFVVGMEGGNGVAKRFAADMGINLCGGDTFMAKHLLHGTEVGTAGDEFGGEAVT